MPKRKAEARWNGAVKDGDGTLKLGSGAFEGPYSFKARFEDGEGTNPEELIAAAHAGCFSMALSAGLSEAETPPDFIETTAEVELRMQEGTITIPRIKLVTRAKVPGIDDETFQKAARAAKDDCPVSKALAGVEEIELEATLEEGDDKSSGEDKNSGADDKGDGDDESDGDE